jgi:uncharacterized protein YjbI with pentapeptide repeats
MVDDFVKKDLGMFIDQSYENKEFQKVVAAGQHVSGREFSRCAFKGCDFGECVLNKSVFADCVFTCCNFSHAKVDQCSFREVVFDDCKLVNVSFTAVNPFLLNWVFKRCKLELCNFGGLKMKHSKFIESLVRKTDFINVDLEKSDFSGSDLQDSKFHNSILEHANFVGARNYYIDPTANRMKKAKFSVPEALSLLLPFGICVEY